MDTQKNDLDDLLKNAMQFSENEIPEPNNRSYKKLRGKVNAKKTSKNPFLRLLSLEVKLYQAALAVAGVAIVCLVLRPVAIPQSSNGLELPGSDTATAYKGSSLKSDSFLVKNFTSGIY